MCGIFYGVEVGKINLTVLLILQTYLFAGRGKTLGFCCYQGKLCVSILRSLHCKRCFES